MVVVGVGCVVVCVGGATLRVSSFVKAHLLSTGPFQGAHGAQHQTK